jgi:hypothetical protein
MVTTAVSPMLISSTVAGSNRVVAPAASPVVTAASANKKAAINAAAIVVVRDLIIGRLLYLIVAVSPMQDPGTVRDTPANADRLPVDVRRNCERWIGALRLLASANRMTRPVIVVTHPVPAIGSGTFPRALVARLPRLFDYLDGEQFQVGVS